MADLRITGAARKSRIFVHTTVEEKEALFQLASEAGYPSMSQYVREKSLHGGGNTPTDSRNVHWELVSAAQKVAADVQTIADTITHGRQPDEELLLVAMQIQELAEEALQEVKAGKGAV